MEFQWQLAPSVPTNQQDVLTALSQSLKVDDFIARLLLQRGVTNYDQAKEYFRPNLTYLHDPFLMQDMQLAVDRIKKAIEQEEKILIYGDYDVDGTSSVALMVTYFRHFYPEHIDYYIPDRYAEGYGVSTQGIDYAIAHKQTLIIALDCGIRAHEKVDYAKDNGIDFIICDHHLPHGDLPNAIAVLDHKRSDCPYPYKELTGCGIGFKLCQALFSTFDHPQAWWTDLLDLVAIATACDIVPITGENRVLVHLGMERLNNQPRKGLQSIIETSNKSVFSVTDVVFTIGPRINAAGRIEHARKAVELLLSDSNALAQQAGELLEQRNTERKELDQKITAEALEMIQDQQLEKQKSTVVFSKDWHKGVVGIVASRLIESYYRPTIVLTESNGKAVGSARSVQGYDIHEALTQCDSLLEQFGGHQYAAGMTLDLKQVPALQQKFESVVTSTIAPELLIPKISVDLEINFDQITPKFWRLIKQFAPFGPENMKPVFLTRKVIDAGWSKAVGGDLTHLKLNLVQPENGVVLNGIAFKFGHLAQAFKQKEPFDIVYTLDENEWQGQVSLQLMIRDIKPHNS